MAPLCLKKKPQVPPLPYPDFLLNLVGSASFMRLSLRKAAHAALSTVEQQEIGYALSKNISSKGRLNCRSLHYAPPDFLLNLVGTASLMRLSLRKAAHVDPFGAAL
jgi:hypothetical protein